MNVEDITRQISILKEQLRLQGSDIEVEAHITSGGFVDFFGQRRGYNQFCISEASAQEAFEQYK